MNPSDQRGDEMTEFPLSEGDDLPPELAAMFKQMQQAAAGLSAEDKASKMTAALDLQLAEQQIEVAKAEAAVAAAELALRTAELHDVGGLSEDRLRLIHAKIAAARQRHQSLGVWVDALLKIYDTKQQLAQQVLARDGSFMMNFFGQGASQQPGDDLIIPHQRDEEPGDPPKPATT
jgi:hypothetical protein